MAVLCGVAIRKRRGRDDMELHQLECFLELSKFQNVSATAEHLNVSQPALSKTISLLESELGVKLFDRVGRRILLNDRGKLFAQYAEHILDSLKEAARNVKTREFQPSGTITIGLFAYVDLIADCVHDFREEYPLVNFRLFSSKSQFTVDNFAALDFTLSSVLGDAVPEREGLLESVPIREEAYLLVSAPELLGRFTEAGPEGVKLASLSEAPFLSMANNLMFTDITSAFCLRAGFSPKIVVQTNDFATKLHMISLGTAMALIPEVCVPVFRGFRTDLLFLPITDVSPRRTVIFSRKNASDSSPLCDLFWQYVKDCYS